MSLTINDAPTARMPDADLAVWRGIPTAVISDELNRTGTMAAAIKPLGDGMGFAGQALTAQTMVGDNATLHYALASAWPPTNPPAATTPASANARMLRRSQWPRAALPMSARAAGAIGPSALSFAIPSYPGVNRCMGPSPLTRYAEAPSLTMARAIFRWCLRSGTARQKCTPLHSRSRTVP